MSLLPRTTLHSDREQEQFPIFFVHLTITIDCLLYEYPENFEVFKLTLGQQLFPSVNDSPGVEDSQELRTPRSRGLPCVDGTTMFGLRGVEATTLPQLLGFMNFFRF
jgi:hypothetical protein